MTKQLLARLTGALLLVTLAVVFLPTFFTGTGLAPIVPEAAVRLELDNAPKPISGLAAEDKTKWQLWQRSEELRGNIASATQVQDFLMSDDSKDADDDASSAALEGESYDLGGTGFSDDGIPLAWSVQVGSFSNKENAVAIKQKIDEHHYLKTEGHGSTLAKLQGKASGAMYRVSVGPFLDRNTAVKVRNVLVNDEVAPNAVVRLFSMAAER